MLLHSIFEIILVAFVFWSVFNEEKYIKFENKLKKLFKRS